MNIAIACFSPSGNTRNVCTRLAKDLGHRGLDCHLVDLTSNRRGLAMGDWAGFWRDEVPSHDLLVVAGPVYAHHLHYNVLDAIQALPPPGPGMGRLAVPLVTYGAISSGVALEEAGKALERTGRIVICGAKLAASHRMTRAFLEQEFNRDVSTEMMDDCVRTLADRISAARFTDHPVSALRSLCYAGWKTRMKARLIFRERMWHAKRYPVVSIDAQACTGCGKCSHACPVFNIERDAQAKMEAGRSACIHCLNCVVTCPAGAIRLSGDLDRARRFMRSAIESHGHKEQPETAVYPISKDV